MSKDLAQKLAEGKVSILQLAMESKKQRQFPSGDKEQRMSDQTAKADAGKIRPTLVPTQLVRDVAVVREYGNRKYGSADNWKQVEIERYRDALCRHLLAYIDNPTSVDEESGIPHYKHMACNMAFICEMEKNVQNEQKMFKTSNLMADFEKKCSKWG